MHHESLYLLMNAREDSEYGRIYDNGGSLSLKILDGAIKYIEDNGYKIVDDIIRNLLARVHEDDKYYIYIELWIPIE